MAMSFVSHGHRSAEGLELASKASALGPLSPLAEQALADFYTAQLARSRKERLRLERCPSRVGSAKWNRQEVYLDEQRRHRASLASRRHLNAHRDWFEGLCQLDSAALREVVAMQHFLDLDLEDLSLPENERRSEDIYSGPGGDVCNQMLLDAARSVFVVAGEEFDFSAELAGYGASIEADPCGVERLQQAFADRLVAAVLAALSEEPPALLVRAVTNTMSQSGLANLERACGGAQVVVCGGEHTLRYELNALEAGSWEVTLFTRKFGFEQCIVYEEEAKEEEPLPVACSPQSGLSKLCRLSFRLGIAGAVEGDVVEVRKEVHLLDERGRRMLGPKRRLWEPVCLLAQLAFRLCTRCAAVCTSAYLAAVSAYGSARARLKLRPGK